MTVVNPKSISGINSITTGSGSDNLLTIHTSDASSTERVRINSSGDVIVGSGITVSPDGDVFATGVTTATTFVGALTGNVTGNISGGTVAGSTGTFTGAVTLADGVSNALKIGDGGDLVLQHNGTNSFIDNNTGDLYIQTTGSGDDILIESADDITLKVAGSETAIQATGDGAVELYNDNTKRLSTTGNGADIFGSGASSAYLKLINTSASSNNSHQFTVDGYNAANSYWNKIQIDASEVLLKTYTGTRATLSNTALTFASGVNIAMANGNGISFAATSDAGGMQNELLDDYEEGTWTPATHDGSVSGQNCKYTKTGNTVHCWGLLYDFSDQSTNDMIKVGGLPFTPTNNHVAGVGMLSYSNEETATHAYVTTSSQIVFYGSSSSSYKQYRHNEINNNAAQIHVTVTYHTAA